MIEASKLRCVEYFQHLEAEASATEEGEIVNPKPSANHYLPATSCSFDFSAKFHNRMMRLNTSWPSDAMTYNGQWYFNWISQFSETGCEKGKFSISHFFFLKGLKTKVYSAGRGHVGVGFEFQHWPDTQLSLLVAWNFLCFRKSKYIQYLAQCEQSVFQNTPYFHPPGWVYNLEKKNQVVWAVLILFSTFVLQRKKI